jgi:EpsI family protein
MLNRALVLFACFLGATGFIAHASQTESVPIRAPFAQLPMQIADWRGAELPPLDAKILAVLGVDDYVNRVYYGGDRSAAGLYIGYYQSQRQGDTIHSPLNCIPGSGWQPVSNAYLTIPVRGTGGSQDISVNRYVIEKGLDRQLVLYWYQSHGRVVANEYWSKFYLVRDAVRLNRTDAALVRVIVPIPPNVDAAETQAEAQGVKFVQTVFPLLADYLPS